MPAGRPSRFSRLYCSPLLALPQEGQPFLRLAVRFPGRGGLGQGQRRWTAHGHALRNRSVGGNQVADGGAAGLVEVGHFHCLLNPDPAADLVFRKQLAIVRHRTGGDDQRHWLVFAALGRQPGQGWGQLLAKAATRVKEDHQNAPSLQLRQRVGLAVQIGQFDGRSFRAWLQPLGHCRLLVGCRSQHLGQDLLDGIQPDQDASVLLQ